MEATLKRKMWKVAIAYFAVSLFVLLSMLPGLDIKLFGYPVFYIEDLGITFLVLQPLSCLLWIVHHHEGLVFVLSLPLYFVWSLCFAWLLIKLDNWLNHFPVLGRKVF
jgi:hypothetical protein